MSIFDDVSSKAQQTPIRPFFTVDREKEKDVHAWIVNSYDVLLKQEKERHDNVSHNFALYKGAEADAKDARPRTQDGADNRRRKERLHVNYLFDLTESQIARITRFKPAIAVEPDEDEHEDKIAAKVAKKFIDRFWDKMGIDKHMTRWHRRTRIAGEDYTQVLWNEDAGGEHPAMKEIGPRLKKGEKIPLLDDAGNEVQDADGNVRHLEKSVARGDLQYRLRSTRQILLEPREEYSQCDWYIDIESMDVDELKAMYPKKAALLKCADTSFEGVDNDRMEDMKLKNRVMTLTLWHRPTKYAEEGAKIVCTRDVLLTDGEWPFPEWRDLNIERLTDIDDEESLHAHSFFTNIEGLHTQYNRMGAFIMQNEWTMAYPKWMMPKGACEIKALGNDRTVVSYKGGVPPSIAQGSPTSPTTLAIRESIREEMRQVGGGSQADRGQPPPGITASVALQFLDEQVQERQSVYVQKNNSAIVNLARMSLGIAAPHLQDDDGRLEEILGKDMARSLEGISIKDIGKPRNIKIINSSALGDSKAAKIQTILDLSERFPSLFGNEQVMDMLELGSVDKMNNIATRALRSAELENENMKQGAPVLPPFATEYHLVHWKTHAQEMQGSDFKKLPPQIQQVMTDHLLATEMFLYDQAKKNPMFAQEVLALPMFPMLYTPDAIQQSAVVPPAPSAGPGPIAQATAAPAPGEENLEMPVDAPAMDAPDALPAEDFVPAS